MISTHRLCSFVPLAIASLHSLSSTLPAAEPPPWLAAPPTIRVAVMGQSYNTTTEHRDFHLQSRQLKPSKPIAWTIAGADVTWYFGTVEKEDRAPSKTLKEGNYDVFILVPNLRQWSSSAVQGKVQAVRFYTDIVRQANPKALIVIDTLWPRATQLGDERAQWLKSNREMIATAIKEADASLPAGSEPIRVAPRGEAIELVYDLVAAGQVPGVEDPLALYGDGGHASELAHHMNGIVEAAVLARCSPLAFPDPKALTPDQARIFKHAALMALVSHPDTGFETPSDSTAPTDVTATEVETAESSRLVLKWRESEDKESGVYGYEIERQDGVRFQTILPRLVDVTVKEGVHYTYKVRAKNFAGVLSSSPAVANAKTPSDTTPPQVTQVAASERQIQIFFSEAIESQSALDKNNYTLSDGVAVTKVSAADPSGRIVVLDVSALQPEKDYKLSLSGLKDRSAKGNTLQRPGIRVQYIPPQWTKLDRDDWDGTVIDLKGDNLLITAQGGYLRAPIFRHPRVVGLHRKMAGDFSFTVALTSQEKSAGACTGILFSPTIEELENDRLGFIGIAPDQELTMDVPPSMEEGLKKARSIIIKGPKGKFLDFPCWLRLIRKGNTFTGYYRLKGSAAGDWQLLGEFTATKSLPDKMLVGVFHHGSTKDQSANTAMFDLSGRDDAANFTAPIDAKERDTTSTIR